MAACYTRAVLQRLYQLWLRRELVATLAVRDLHSRYKGTTLGILWAVLQPLVLALVYTLAFRYVIRIAIPNYVLHLMAGLIPWLFVSSSISAGALSVTGQAQLVKKVAFPREVLPIATVVAQFSLFALAYLIVVPALAAIQVGIGLALLALPVIMLLLGVFTGGLALMVSAAQVYARATRHLLDVALQVWFWVTPILYSFDLIPERFRIYFHLNPMTAFVEAHRVIVLDRTIPDARAFLVLVAWAVASAAIGYVIFVRAQRRFAEYV